MPFLLHNQQHWSTEDFVIKLDPSRQKPKQRTSDIMTASWYLISAQPSSVLFSSYAARTFAALVRTFLQTTAVTLLIPSN